MKFDELVDRLYFWLPFVLLLGIVGIAVASEFGCAMSAEGSFFRLTDNIVQGMQRQPALLG